MKKNQAIKSRKEIEEIISKIDEEELFWKAWSQHNDNYRTEVWMLLNGEIKIIPNLLASKRVKFHTPAILLFKFERNLTKNFPYQWKGDILTLQEYIEAMKLLENGKIRSFREYMKKKNIDFFERFGRYYENNFAVIDWYIVMKQLDEIYDTIGTEQPHAKIFKKRRKKNETTKKK